MMSLSYVAVDRPAASQQTSQSSGKDLHRARTSLRCKTRQVGDRPKQHRVGCLGSLLGDLKYRDLDHFGHHEHWLRRNWTQQHTARTRLKRLPSQRTVRIVGWSRWCLALTETFLVPVDLVEHWVTGTDAVYIRSSPWREEKSRLNFNYLINQSINRSVLITHSLSHCNGIATG